MSQQLKLKVLWLKNFLGLGIDQITTKQQYPLTKYYFWPRTEAWEQIKSELDSKSWLDKKEKVRILNLTADVMNYWKNNRNTTNVETAKNNFFEAEFFHLQN